MQRVWNLMFTFIGPVHFVILTHHHHNNTYTCATYTHHHHHHIHIHKKVYFFSQLLQKWHYMQQFCILLPKQYTWFKRRLCPITFYSWKKVFPPLVVVILDSPCLPFLLIYTNHKYKIKSWANPTFLFPWRITHPVGGWG